MAYIKTLKDNELIGGTDTTDVYPVSSTQAIFRQNPDGTAPTGVPQRLEDSLRNYEEELNTISDKIDAIEDLSKAEPPSTAEEMWKTPLFEIFANAACTQKPVVGTEYSTLYAKLYENISLAENNKRLWGNHLELSWNSEMSADDLIKHEVWIEYEYSIGEYNWHPQMFYTYDDFLSAGVYTLVGLSVEFSSNWPAKFYSDGTFN